MVVWNRGLSGQEYTTHYKNGFRGGRKKGFKLSKETKIKMSESKKGIRFSKQHRENISKSKKGIKPNLSKEQKEKQRQRMLGNSLAKGYSYHKGKKFSEETKRKMSKNSRMTRLEERKKHSAKLQGISIEEWKGFKNTLNKRLRLSSKWKIWREVIFLRDNFTCQNTNCSFCKNKIGVLLHPHHIKLLSEYPELTFNINNGITYCAEFHLKSELHKNNNIIEKEVIM